MTVTVHPVIAAAFAALDAAGLRWCLLRGRDRLAVPTGDVDLLVAQGSAAGVRAAVAEVPGVLHQRTWAGGSQSFFLATDAADGWSVVIHCVDRVSFGPYGCFETAEGSGVLERRVERDGVSSAADGDEFWITLVHALVDKASVAEKHRDRLRSLAAAAPLDHGLARTVNRLRPKDMDAAGLVGLVRDGKWGEIEALGGALLDAWWRVDRALAVPRWVSGRTSLTARKAGEHLRRSGLLVAVLAPDGAGKSTVVDALAGPGGLPFGVVRFYAGAYGEAVSSRLPKVPGVRLLARVALLASAGVRARWQRRRRRVALFDRHPLELRLVGARSARRALLASLVPEPDLLLVLDAPGAELHRRSGEHDAATLEESRQRYLGLASRSASAVVIDATQAIDAVVADARRAVIERWGAR